MKIENKNCIHCEKEARQRGVEGQQRAKQRFEGDYGIYYYGTRMFICCCVGFTMLYSLCACVCVCDYTYTNKQCHTHCSSTLGAAAATAVVVVVLVGIFGLQSSFDCFSLCH